MITAVAAAKQCMLVHVFVQILMFLSWNLVTAEQCVILLFVSLGVQCLYLHVAVSFIARSSHTFQNMAVYRAN